jgi:hypothetical protein
MSRFVTKSVVMMMGSAALLVAASTASEHVAFAQPAASADAHEKAATAFQEGRKLIDAGSCDLAVPKLKESLQFESSIGARLSIADCIEKGDPLGAWRVLKEAASLSLINRDDRLAVAEQRAQGLQSRIAMITFKLPAGAELAGFELRVDGDLVDRYLYRSGYATTSGRHVVEATAGVGTPSPRRFVGSVSVENGVQANVDVDLRRDDCKTPRGGAATSAATPSASSASMSSSGSFEDRGSSRRALALAVGGLGLAGVATGVVFGLLTLDKKDSIEASCGGSVGNCAAPRGSVDPETEAAKTSAAISTVSFAVGGAALLGAAVIYITAPSSSPSQPIKTGIRVSPQAQRGGAGLGIGGTF